MKKTFFLFCCLICLLMLSSCQEDDAEHTHDYTSTVISPTCTEDGYTLHQCSSCEERYTDQVTPKTGHTYGESVRDAYCNQFQKKVFTCSVCKHSYDESLTVKGTLHDYTAVVTYPDRENQGYTTHTCEYCRDSYVDSYTDPVDFSIGLAYTKVTGGYCVSGIGSCTDTEIIVPSVSEQGYRVVGIAQYAFENTNARSITVNDGVSYIESYAFYQCASLESVAIGKNVNVSEDIFFHTPVLAKLTMAMNYPISYYFKHLGDTPPEGYKALKLGDGSISSTYYGAIPYSLREVNLLTSPRMAVLKNCSMLTSITIPSDATSIGASAFAGCTGLTAFTIPETVKSIGNSAFMGTSIISIVIPKSVVFKAEDQSVFSGCKQLREVTILSESTVMPSYMFLNCSSLQALEVPSCVTSLGVSFLANTSIERFTVPIGVTELLSHTFAGCEKLVEIVLPVGMRVIEQSALEGCAALKTVRFGGTVEEAKQMSWFAQIDLDKITVICTSGTVEKEK